MSESNARKSNIDRLAVLDHLVYAVPDLAAGCDAFEARSGVRPELGGQHLGLGTHNALVSFGDGYIELIAPDPAQPAPRRPRPFGVEELITPHLATFAVRPAAGRTIDDVVAALGAIDCDPGPPLSMSRVRPDGIEMQWQLTQPSGAADGLVPFVIDWGDTPNPATSAVAGVSLDRLSAPPDQLGEAQHVLSALGVSVESDTSASARFSAHLSAGGATGPARHFTL